MIALVLFLAAFTLIACGLTGRAREARISSRIAASEARILAAVGSPVQVESAAVRNKAAFGEMPKERVR